MRALMVRAGTIWAALDVMLVRETLRPLPLSPAPGAPAWVLGLSRVRGATTPVVDLRQLLGAVSPAPAARWVIFRGAEAWAAGAVDEVSGVVTLESEALRDLPPLLSSGGALEAVAQLDQRLVVLLQAARLVPPEVWARLQEQAG